MSSNRSHTDHVQEQCEQAKKGKSSSGAEGPTIPQILRDYGELYIGGYRPPQHHIKFIRAVRVCKSPALGGKMLVCSDCGHQHYIYHSCGHSRCPCCQAIKREQWIDKMQSILLPVPYVHLVTTWPRELRRLARTNQRVIYSLLFRATKKTVWQIIQDPNHVGANPGMVSVLHTFGSDMKYHVHVHSMVTFGGLSADGRWIYPKHKKRLARNSKLRTTYRDTCLAELKEVMARGELITDKSYAEIHAELSEKQWSVHVSHPSMTTEGIVKYLSKYINRVAISEKRVEYIKKIRRVGISYKDYRNAKDDQAPPIEQKHMHPLTFIEQLLQHLPPPYFHRSRRYGLHANSKSKTTKAYIAKATAGNSHTVRTVMEIIKHLAQAKPLKCERCASTEFEEHVLKPDKTYKYSYLTLPSIRGPDIQILTQNSLGK